MDMPQWKKQQQEMDPVWKKHMDSVLFTFKQIHFALGQTNFPDFIKIGLKPLQVRCWDNLLQKRDVMAVLPTGYGKSLVFQLLPHVMPLKDSRNFVLVIAPLSSIIQDQVSSLPSKKITPVVFKSEYFTEKIESLYHQDIIDQEDALTELTDQHLTDGQFDLLFAHPEAMLSEDGRNLMKTHLMKKNVVAIVIDEAHCVATW